MQKNGKMETYLSSCYLFIISYELPEICGICCYYVTFDQVELGLEVRLVSCL